MSQEEQPMKIHYQGQVYANLGQIPFPKVGFGESQTFSLEIENIHPKHLLTDLRFESNLKSTINPNTGMAHDPFTLKLPNTILPGKKQTVFLHIDGTALFNVDPDITQVVIGIAYNEERSFA